MDISMMQELITLDKESGKLYWKKRPPEYFKSTNYRDSEGCANNWNSRYEGKECLTAIGSHGYRHGNLVGKGVLAHRVVFALANGYIPSCIDHINGNRLDNRPENLREATYKENSANSKSRNGSTSIYLGVSWNKSLQKWNASITKNGITETIGFYISESLAAKAYNERAIVVHGEYARVNKIDS